MNEKDILEVKKIKECYQVKTKTKLDELRKLHSKAYGRPLAISLVLGFVFSLVLGAGTSMVLTDTHFALGIAIGSIGLVLCGLNYPLYI